MKKTIFTVFLSVILILFVITAIGVMRPAGDGDNGTDRDPEVISPGIFILAERGSMAKSGMRGSEICFSRDDFSRALNLRGVSEITFTSVPPATDGKLLVGNTVINSGQTVSGSNISLITFRAASDSVSSTSFTFAPNGEAYDVSCSLYFLDEVNYAPTVSIAPAVSLDVSTYENVTHYGKLSAFDPDGDECIYEIVSYPKKGLITLSGEGGEYVYTPSKDFVGKDSFCYVARDKYGNYSASAEVSVEVSRVSLSSVFEDMDNSDAHAAAIKLSEAGIMSGTQIGDGYYFGPDKAVSRSEFVVLAMQALGIRDVNNLRTTGFFDDSDIPASMRGYIAAARELDYVSGTYIDGKLCFLPNESITRAEAAVIVSRMIEAATPVIAPIFADAEDVPAWAQSSLSSLAAMGVIETSSQKIGANEVMTRGDTAKMLVAVMSINK